jgi:hypothetical protein
VEPIPAPGPVATGAPAVPAAAPTAAPQVADEEAPHAHPAAETFSRSAPVSAEPESSQLAVGVVLGLVTVLAAIKVGAGSSGNQRWWHAGGVLAGGALGTGVITCALGQTSPTRHGGCAASIAGALIGAAGVLPGLLLLKWEASQPCTATGPNDDDACATDAAVDAIFALAVAGGGYVLGTAFGARSGWELGATTRFTAPPTANVSLLSLQF